ncbi:hypothetical protein HNQ92_003911 [Rhabdobacter roseus]|uniref:Uncharacterized protein n=1 Tax=Rhabdobacter roseus TaxID=1655419 RepID=A0A840TPP4_9BACT|nr:hypothetical protein [Rhabdobacter roseus]MBB5285751.1 hypothetical protein [Rhabdobacter roseus]
MKNTLEQLYEKLSRSATPIGRLETTGGVPFEVEAREVKPNSIETTNEQSFQDLVLQPESISLKRIGEISVTDQVPESIIMLSPLMSGIQQ